MAAIKRCALCNLPWTRCKGHGRATPSVKPHGFIIEHANRGVYVGHAHSLRTGDWTPKFSTIIGRTEGMLFATREAAEKVIREDKTGRMQGCTLWELSA